MGERELNDGQSLDLLRESIERLAAVMEQQGHRGSNSSAQSNKSYKVLTQKDKWFSGKFDPDQLEKALNAYAEQGWVLKCVTTAEVGAARDEIIMILER